MSILDRIDKTRVDVRKVVTEKKFVIRPDVCRDTFLSENKGYPVYLSALCGFDPESGIVREMYEKKLSEVYDEICEYPGISEVSPIWVVTMQESLIPLYVKRGYEICFGIKGDVRSVYGALRMLYGLCSLLWFENSHIRVPVALIYYFNGQLQRSYMRYDFFDEFYRKGEGMYGAWMVFGSVLAGILAKKLGDRQFKFAEKMCFKRFESENLLPRGVNLVNISNKDVCVASESVSKASSITTRQSDFERYCGQFLRG